MKKQGFTLIELLAVIVILAVIAIIVTPVVTGIISKTKLSADMRSAEGYVKAAEDYFADSQINDDKKGRINTNIVSDIDISGNNSEGDVRVDEKGQVSMAVVINNKCYKKNSTDGVNNISVSDDIDNCDVINYVIPPDRCFTTVANGDGVDISKYLCGDTVLINDGMDVTFDKDGEYVDVQVPTTIGGKKVISLVKGAFFTLAVGDKVGVKSLKITDGIITKQSIGKNELSSLILPNNLLDIPYKAITANLNLKYIKIPASVTTMGSNSFMFNGLETVVFEKSEHDLAIGFGSFQSNQIKKLILSDNITEIGDYAFEENPLKTVDIPNSVTTIGDDSFISCNNLTTINIDNTSNSITGAPWGATSATVNWLR